MELEWNGYTWGAEEGLSFQTEKSGGGFLIDLGIRGTIRQLYVSNNRLYSALKNSWVTISPSVLSWEVEDDS